LAEDKATGIVIHGALETRDGRILSWSNDRTLCLWDPITGEAMAVLAGHTAPVERAFVMPDGAIVSWAYATGYLSDKTLRLWDAATGAIRSVLQGHTKQINGALVLDDCRVLSWSSDETLRLWDTGIEQTTHDAVAGHADPVTGAVAMPDLRLLSWSGKGNWLYDHTLRLWDGITGAPEAVLEGHTEAVEGALLLPDGRILSWSRDRTLRIWDSATAKPLRVLEGHKNEVWGAVSLPDGRILSWSCDGTLRFWDMTTGEPGPVLQDWEPVSGALVLPSGAIFCWTQKAESGREPGGSFSLWEMNAGTDGWQRNALFPVFEETVVLGGLIISDSHVELFSPDWHVGLFSPRALIRWDVTQPLTPAEKDKLYSEIGHSWGWQLPDVRILTWFDCGALTLRNGTTGGPGPSWLGHSAAVWGALALPDGRILSWSEDRTLRVWDSLSGRPGPLLEGHTGGVLGALVMPDQRILSWSLDNTVRLWRRPAAMGSSQPPQPIRPGHVVAWHGLAAARVEAADAHGRVVVCSDDGYVIPVFLHIGAERAAFSDLP
jgi:WD40 repeat protein